MSKTQDFESNVFKAISIAYLAYAASFISSIVVARLLGAEGKGIVSLFRATIFGIVVFSSLGIGQGQIYHVSKDPDKLKYFLPNAFVFSFILGGGGAVVYFLAGWLSGLKIVTILSWPLILLGIIATPILSYLIFQRQFLLSIHAYKLSKLSYALAEVIPLLVFLGIYFTGNASVVGFIIAFVFSQYLCGVLCQYMIRKKKKIKSSLSISFARESLQFGIRDYLNNSIIYLITRLDFFLVMFFLGQYDLGIYSVSVTLAEVVSRLSHQLGTILFPVFAGREIEFRTDPLAMLRKIIFILSVVSLVLFAISRPLIELLFGPQFIDAVLPFQILILGAIAWGIIHVTLSHISGGGNPELGIPVFLSTAVINTFLDILLIPRYGLIGAAIASVFSYWVAAVMLLVIFCNRENFRFVDATILKIEDIKSILALLMRLR